MTVTGYLYKRIPSTPRNPSLYPNLIDELESSYIPDSNKIRFRTEIGKFEGFQKKHTNKIRTTSHINQLGQLSQHSKQHGMDGHDVDIFGIFNDKTHADILDDLAEQTSQFSADYPEGVIGLYIEKAPKSVNKDCTTTQGYCIIETETGRIARKSTVWDFRCTLRFNGVLKIAD
ncbi:MAG: hypothetical protein HRU07_06630 [Nitrosopumilus sp.]|nr:hypothetical protein [Nitrosopumilus sp.]NRA05816.1 hypothetical protein [Nitrosopumilus sp.]